MNDILIKYSQLGDIFDFFSMGVMVLSPERQIISLNQSAEIITGYAASDLVGQNCTEQLMNSLCGGNCAFLQAVEEGRKSGTMDIEVTGKDNETRNITRIVSPAFMPPTRSIKSEMRTPRYTPLPPQLRSWFWKEDVPCIGLSSKRSPRLRVTSSIRPLTTTVSRSQLGVLSSTGAIVTPVVFALTLR